ncbi:MAG: hypothetical protein ACXWIN_03590, partial [Burkholderiaceae bacterium]
SIFFTAYRILINGEVSYFPLVSSSTSQRQIVRYQNFLSREISKCIDDFFTGNILWAIIPGIL